MATDPVAQSDPDDDSQSDQAESDKDLEQGFLNSAQEYSDTAQDEFSDDYVISKSAYESRVIRFGLIGVFATFFTWGWAYVFEYLVSPHGVYLFAFLFFFTVPLAMLVSLAAFLLRVQYLLPYLRRRLIGRTIKFLRKYTAENE